MGIRWQLISLLMKNSQNYETRYKIRRIFEKNEGSKIERVHSLYIF